MESKNFETITESFDSAVCIYLYVDGEKTTFNKGDQKYEQILNSLKKITDGAYDMPAFGVSLDGETRKSINTGFWIELEFETTLECNGMLFESLLIEVNSGYGGFNLIRKTNGKYDGRCFYLQLQTTMQLLFDEIKNISDTL